MSTYTLKIKKIKSGKKVIEDVLIESSEGINEVWRKEVEGMLKNDNNEWDDWEIFHHRDGDEIYACRIKIKSSSTDMTASTYSISLKKS